MPFAFTAITGIGKRYAILCTKKAGIDVGKRAGELNKDQVEKLVQTLAEPRENGVPDWFLNRQKDRVDGTTSHILSNDIGARLRMDLERLKKIRHHRGLRHYWGLRVRGQHTSSTGRRGRVVGKK